LREAVNAVLGKESRDIGGGTATVAVVSPELCCTRTTRR
jgi:hypothetical protein